MSVFTEQDLESLGAVSVFVKVLGGKVYCYSWKCYGGKGSLQAAESRKNNKFVL